MPDTADLWLSSPNSLSDRDLVALLIGADSGGAGSAGLLDVIDFVKRRTGLTRDECVKTWEVWSAIQGVSQSTFRQPSELERSRSQFNSARADLRDQLLAMGDASCTYCGDSDADTIDHVVPLSRGGGNELENLVLACRSCNTAKGTRIYPDEWSPQGV